MGKDLPDIAREVPAKVQQPLLPNRVAQVWSKWLMVKKPRKVAQSRFPEESFIDVPKSSNPRVELADIPHPPKWGEKYRMKPGPKSLRPKWCPKKAWETAQKRKQRGAAITDAMLRQIIKMQKSKAAAHEAAK